MYYFARMPDPVYYVLYVLYYILYYIVFCIVQPWGFLKEFLEKSGSAKSQS